MSEVEFGRQYTDYQLDRGTVRKLIRRFYMKHAAKYVRGRALDFGCGVGDLLRLLPAGSLGYEINPSTVQYCISRGLNVRLYSPDIDEYRFHECEPDYFQTFVVSHVLEHLERPENVLRSIFRSCARLGVSRLILIVPGLRGFNHDKTHKTFVDLAFLKSHKVDVVGAYVLTRCEYFPFNRSWVGNYFAHNELVVIYDRKRPDAGAVS